MHDVLHANVSEIRGMGRVFLARVAGTLPRAWLCVYIARTVMQPYRLGEDQRGGGRERGRGREGEGGRVLGELTLESAQ